MSASLVGSEMCIRDRPSTLQRKPSAVCPWAQSRSSLRLAKPKSPPRAARRRPRSVEEAARVGPAAGETQPLERRCTR
eukprot:6145689-Alexandrium_andersonii.AAC.1